MENIRFTNYGHTVDVLYDDYTWEQTASTGNRKWFSLFSLV